MNLLDFNNFYFVGIKGVAMTSLAQCLIDAGKNVTGCDLEENFVTEKILTKLQINIDKGFQIELPASTDCLIYTSAHQGQYNPMVIQAKEKKISTFSQAEALGFLFNQKKGVAVCGVGGKSTVTAMLVWITTQNKVPTSFSVGVGNIPKLNKTGHYDKNDQYFIAEADEYVTDPLAPENNQPITPRFSHLHPNITICTNLKFDHPDVYQNFEDTKSEFKKFFKNIKPGGTLIINGDDLQLSKLVTEMKLPNINIFKYGQLQQCDLKLKKIATQDQQTFFELENNGQTYQASLPIPGIFNVLNALAAISAAMKMGISIDSSITALKNFPSTQRRFQFMGKKNNVLYYDDYAHHPHEITAVIKAIKKWHPNKEIIVAFQPHTYTRTKQLFDEFVESLMPLKNLILLQIFASAREKSDPSISSLQLAQAITAINPDNQPTVLKNFQELAQYCQNHYRDNQVVITLGAGDIYKAHQLIKS